MYVKGCLRLSKAINVEKYLMYSRNLMYLVLAQRREVSCRAIALTAAGGEALKLFTQQGVMQSLQNYYLQN